MSAATPTLAERTALLFWVVDGVGEALDAEAALEVPLSCCASAANAEDEREDDSSELIAITIP